jgi:uncharacterized protein (TIGR03067 family)
MSLHLNGVATIRTSGGIPMIRKILCVAAVVALVAGGVSLGGDTKVAGDLKKIQGAWKFTAHAAGDKAAPPEELAKMKITFTGDKFTVTVDDKVVQAGTHKVDASKKPAQVDSDVAEGEGKGSTMLGIYELKGNTLRVCFDPAGKARPTSFTAKEGQFSATLERIKR